MSEGVREREIVGDRERVREREGEGQGVLQRDADSRLLQLLDLLI